MLSKVYFPGLNGLRFFAALSVVLTHIELTKKLLGHGEGLWIDINNRIPTNGWDAIMSRTIRWQSPFITDAGPQGVVFFFVLSGFLITYLLLKEKDVSGTISVKKFYVRRILRIWPLYYLIVILGFFVLPYLGWFDIPKQEVHFMAHFGVTLVCYLFLFPNLAFALYEQAVPNIGQTWSIGVEEQFYIIWPFFVKHSKNVLKAICIFIFVLLVIKTIALRLARHDEDGVIDVVARFLSMSKIESMALGGIGAYIAYHQKHRWLNFIYSLPVQIAAYLTVPVVILFSPSWMRNGVHLIYSVAFLVIIMNVAANPKSLLKFRHRILEYLGKISYGIYMYHIICITLVLHVMKHFLDMPQSLTQWQNLLMYSVSISLTILVSAISYRFFEKKFIERKRNYTTVVSGDDAKA